MMPPESSSETSTPASCGRRPKRAAATKAEGVFKQLASAGQAPSSTGVSDNPDASPKVSKSVLRGQTPALAVAAPVPESHLEPQQQQRLFDKESGKLRRGAVEGLGGEEPASESAKGTRKERAKRGGAEGSNKADGPLKSSRRDSSSCQPKPRMKPKGVSNGASVIKLVDNFSSFGKKVRVPANATIDDAWNVLDDVLSSFPKTSGLTADELAGHAKLQRYTRRPRVGGGHGSGSGDEYSNRCTVRAYRPHVYAIMSVFLFIRGTWFLFLLLVSCF